MSSPSSSGREAGTFPACRLRAEHAQARARRRMLSSEATSLSSELSAPGRVPGFLASRSRCTSSSKARWSKRSWTISWRNTASAISPSCAPIRARASEARSISAPSAPEEKTSPCCVRSCCSSAFAMVQPWSTRPRTLRAGTRAPSKRVSQNGDLPLMRRVGRTETPGVSRSSRRNVMPSCFRAVVRVRTMQNIQSDASP